MCALPYTKDYRKNTFSRHRPPLPLQHKQDGILQPVEVVVRGDVQEDVHGLPKRLRSLGVDDAAGAATVVLQLRRLDAAALAAVQVLAQVKTIKK